MLLPEIATRIAALRFEDIPDEAVGTARLAILDTIGVTLAGAVTDTAAVVGRALAPTIADGPATLMGLGRRADILSAALVNGVAAHALDFDDCSNTIGGHPSAPILPALWALAEARGAGGPALIEAYVAGFETETRLARAVNFHHYEKGWHPTATLGTFGAAAACGRLMRLDPERLATALAIAASMAAGIKANFGTMVKPFHVGQCTRNGLLAAMLAAEGMTANPEALEHPQGFLAVFNGLGTFDAARILDGWADPLDIVEPGVAFKRHPCCGSTHPAIDALLALRAEHGLEAADVGLVESWTHPRRLRHTDRPDPRTGLDGKFSVQYVLARALLEGEVRLEHFCDAAVHEPTVRTVMSRVRAAPHPDAVSDTGEHFFALVRVTTRDGTQLERFVDRPLGRDRAHPLPEGAIEGKFRDCAGQVQDPESVAALEGLILTLDRVPDIRIVSEAMIRGTSHAAASRRALADANE